MDHTKLTIVLSTRPTSAVSGQEKTGQIQNTEAYCFLACASEQQITHPIQFSSKTLICIKLQC